MNTGKGNYWHGKGQTYGMDNMDDQWHGGQEAATFSLCSLEAVPKAGEPMKVNLLDFIKPKKIAKKTAAGSPKQPKPKVQNNSFALLALEEVSDGEKEETDFAPPTPTWPRPHLSAARPAKRTVSLSAAFGEDTCTCTEGMCGYVPHRLDQTIDTRVGPASCNFSGSRFDKMVPKTEMPGQKLVKNSVMPGQKAREPGRAQASGSVGAYASSASPGKQNADGTQRPYLWPIQI